MVLSEVEAAIEVGERDFDAVFINLHEHLGLCRDLLSHTLGLLFRYS